MTKTIMLSHISTKIILYIFTQLVPTRIRNNPYKVETYFKYRGPCIGGPYAPTSGPHSTARHK